MNTKCAQLSRAALPGHILMYCCCSRIHIKEMSLKTTSVKFISFISVIVLFFYMISDDSEEDLDPPASRSQGEFKYILDWRRLAPDKFSFKNRDPVKVKKVHCHLFPNCFVTNDREYFSDMRQFDAVLFHGMMLPTFIPQELPRVRSPRQKYIFATRESAHNYPICDKFYDGYFNWTSSYRLDSDVRWGYVTIYDLEGNFVGPRINMSWKPLHKPIDIELRTKLKSKSKAATWFASHCATSSRRERFVAQVAREMTRYNMTLDVYGKCGQNNTNNNKINSRQHHKLPYRNKKTIYNLTYKKDTNKHKNDAKKKLCPKNHWFCNKMIEKDYYFYFSFENSIDEDYVTEKLLTALNNLAVPVVYGGADYSRFLPPGSYLDGRALGAKNLVKTMRDIISNWSRYEEMFRWRNYYQYKESHFLSDVCNMCAKLSQPGAAAEETIYEEFRAWWNKDPAWCNDWRKDELTGLWYYKYIKLNRIEELIN